MVSHKGLVEIGYRWCLGRCGFAFKELKTIEGEVPDVIGFNSCGTFLLEAKVSRADFLQDKKKMVRANGQGMGDWRFYIAPEGMISPEELPRLWGLIEVGRKGKAKVTANPFGKGNIYSIWQRNKKNEKAERAVLYSALRRLQERKLIDAIYAQ